MGDYEDWVYREYDKYIDNLLGECGHRQPTDPNTTCDINGKICLLEENLPCSYQEDRDVRD